MSELYFGGVGYPWFGMYESHGTEPPYLYPVIDIENMMSQPQIDSPQCSCYCTVCYMYFMYVHPRFLQMYNDYFLKLLIYFRRVTETNSK